MQASQFLIFKNILTEAITRGAADLHFSVGNAPALRIKGELVTMDDQDLVSEEAIKNLVDSLLTEEQQKKLAANREIILTHNFDRNLRFKINIFYQRETLSATLRHIPERVATVDFLGLSPIVKDLCRANKGLIIVSGHFGSGRSTTVAAMLEEINQTQKKYIITIEDPIEHVFVNQKSIIEQREIGRDTKSWKDAVTYFEEEDGDVLFVEEMADPEIVPLVLEIARGSSLVITTMTASSASNTVSRILDSFKSFDQERIRNLLATSLKAVICQKLVPKIGGGSILVQEVMLMSDAIRSVINGGNVGQIDNIIQTSRKENMISFAQALADLVKNHKISESDATDSLSDPALLKNLIK